MALRLIRKETLTNMKKSKKGITLVELVICCAIIVMLGGACTAVLASGAKIFNTSSQTANAQLDADVLQNFMINNLPSAQNPNYDCSLDEAKALTDGIAIYVEDNALTIQVNGNATSIRSITEFKYSFVKAGDSGSSNARTQFQYVATLNNGSTLEGGYILGNEKYSSSLPRDLLASAQPLCFIPDSESES